MTSRWVYLALAIVFAFAYVQEAFAKSVNGLELKEVERVAALVPESVAAGQKLRYRRSPKKHKHGGTVIIINQHHGHHGHHGHHHHG